MYIFELEKVKLEIEKYDKLIKTLNLMKIDHLFYNNICKGDWSKGRARALGV